MYNVQTPVVLGPIEDSDVQCVVSSPPSAVTTANPIQVFEEI